MLIVGSRRNMTEIDTKRARWSVSFAEFLVTLR